jgi:hypothetical protein
MVRSTRLWQSSRPQKNRKLHNITQQRSPLSEYLDRFDNQLNVLRQCGETLVMPGVMKYSALLEEVDHENALPVKRKKCPPRPNKRGCRISLWVQHKAVRTAGSSCTTSRNLTLKIFKYCGATTSRIFAILLYSRLYFIAQ